MEAEFKKISSVETSPETMNALVRLVGGLTHDFNNTFTVIDGHASILRYLEAMPEEGIDSVEEIKKAVKRAAGITQQMLIVAQRHRVTLSRFRFSDFFETHRLEFKDLVGAGITFELICDLPGEVVSADQELLLLLLTHLFSNARDGLQMQGVIQIKLSLAGGKFVRLTVRDQGEGIPPEVLRHVFEPYFTTKPRGSGKGLGLALVCGIARLHGGWAEIESAPGSGTVVNVFLPIPEVEQDLLPAPPQPPLRTERPLSDKKVFVIDDDANIRTLVEIALKRTGCELVLAGSFAEARLVWEEHRDSIDLALVDLVLPEGRVGILLAEEIAAEAPNLPIILMSGFYGTDEERQLVQARGFSFIAKPFDFNLLVELIRSRLLGTSV